MLNTQSPIPLYQQLAAQLRRDIDSGVLSADDKIPSENELAQQLGIGRPTVRQATDLLVREGVLQRRRGSGTYVLPPGKRIDLFSLAGTSAALGESQLSSEVEICVRSGATMPADDAAPKSMQIAAALQFRSPDPHRRRTRIARTVLPRCRSFPGVSSRSRCAMHRCRASCVKPISWSRPAPSRPSRLRATCLTLRRSCRSMHRSRCCTSAGTCISVQFCQCDFLRSVLPYRSFPVFPDHYHPRTSTQGVESCIAAVTTTDSAEPSSPKSWCPPSTNSRPRFARPKKTLRSGRVTSS